MAYRIDVTRNAAADLARLPRPIRDRVRRKIEGLAVNPRPAGCRKLVGSNFYRVRVGDYRVIYDVRDAALVVVIVRVGHRRDVYD